ncbi:MAG: efflux RND transporter periplasmic adaptor subunit [Thiotrichales bacterium]|nr:efflux RND transporter periplasmic adaptor subunit [Thiotrichales bacterium]
MKIFVVIITTVITVALLLWTRPESKAELQPLPVARVLATQVQTMDIQAMTVLTGKLQPARRAELRFELSGRVIQRFVEPGDQVTGGDLLLQIDDGDFTDKHDEMLALLRQEEQAIKRDQKLLDLIVRERQIQEREVERLERLGQESLASKSNFDSALQGVLKLKGEESRLRHSVETAGSRLLSKQAQLNQAARNLERTRLVTPFPATVNSVMYETGDYANAGQVAVEVVQLNELDLYLEVTSAMVGVLHLGQTVNVNTGRQDLQGRLVAIESDPEPDTLTHAIRIRIDGSGLYPGQLAEVSLPGVKLENAEVVPTSAILYDEGQSYLFTIRNDRLQRIPVKTLVRHKDWQSVSGINPGTIIVERDVAALADGQQVSLQ